MLGLWIITMNISNHRKLFFLCQHWSVCSHTVTFSYHYIDQQTQGLTQYTWLLGSSQETLAPEGTLASRTKTSPWRRPLTLAPWQLRTSSRRSMPTTTGWGSLWCLWVQRGQTTHLVPLPPRERLTTSSGSSSSERESGHWWHHPLSAGQGLS